MLLAQSYYPFSVGFDCFFDEEETNAQKTDFPRYNLSKVDEQRYILEMALAGFKKKDLKITLKTGNLSIEGKNQNEKESSHFLHRGISSRNFKRVFTVADSIEVNDAKMEDGILKIQLINKVPETKKPKSISIA